MDRRRLLFTAITAVPFGVLCLSVGFLVRQRRRSQLWMTPRLVVEGDGPFYRPDPQLGYAMSPGTYRFSIHAEGYPPLTFTATNGTDGYRITSRSRPQPAREIWLFGCSYTWGWPLRDEEAFAWLLQEQLPQYRVRNYGTNGYGNVQALIQLRALLAASAPEVVVVTYGQFHLRRNVAAPSRLSEFRILDDFRRGLLRHPRAFLDDGGRLHVELVPFDGPKAPDPPLETQIRVTTAIMNEIYVLSRQHAVRPTLAVMAGDPLGDEVVAGCRRLGFEIVDLNIDHSDPANLCVPWDSHPNAKAHRAYATRLSGVLK